MRLAVIESGAVVNVIDVAADAIPEVYRDMPEAPAGVGVGYLYDGQDFAPPPPPPVTAAMVEAEAERRERLVASDRDQRRMIATRQALLDKGRANWTAEETGQWEATETVWDAIAAISAAADALTGQDPIPQDFRDEKHWP